MLLSLSCANASSKSLDIQVWSVYIIIVDVQQFIVHNVLSLKIPASRYLFYFTTVIKIVREFWREKFEINLLRHLRHFAPRILLPSVFGLRQNFVLEENRKTLNKQILIHILPEEPWSSG